MKRRRSYPKTMKQKVSLEWLETPGRMPAVAQDHGVTCGMIRKWEDSSLFHQLNEINSDFLYFNDLKKHTMLTSKL
jgi:hypothetical protein